MLLIYATALFLSAALLFMVQPMMGKMILPLLGGSPAVWNTEVAFCQALLVLGYLYAHASSRWLGIRKQAILQCLLILLPFCFLPIQFRPDQALPPEADPVFWLLGLLGTVAGVPFFVLTTTSPILQKWFSSTSHPRSGDPYFLFAASNAGSLIGLVAYPTVIEPFLDLATQRWLWETGYGLLVAVTLACGVTLWRSPRKPQQERNMPRAVSAGPTGVHGLVWGRRLGWIGAAFVPSSLMLSVTTYLSTNIAPVPLLWVIPLALYLLSFILVFTPGIPLPSTAVTRLLPGTTLTLLLVIILGSTQPVGLMFAIHLAGFFVLSVALHGSLARDRPSPAYLTEFYLWISLGGVAGGIFNSMLAPVLFTTLLEYPLVLLLGVLLLAWQKKGKATFRPLDLLLPVGLGLLMLGLIEILEALQMRSSLASHPFLLVLPAAVCYTFSTRPFRFALGMGCLWLAGLQYSGEEGFPLYRERNFFGVHQVFIDDNRQYHLLSHSGTLHGKQSLEPSRRCLPLTYYHPSGPLGQLFMAFREEGQDWEVAGVGLGTGSMASYARPGQKWTFYEVDPTVIRIATDNRFFSYLSECSSNITIVPGDARISLAREGVGRFDLIILDAYSSDSIPIHLITREALEIYLERLSDRGLLVFHISNQYLELGSVLAGLARDLALVYRQQNDLWVNREERALGKEPSEWALMARSPQHLGPLLRDPRWQEGESGDSLLWTDSYSSILSVLKWTGR